MKSQNNFYRNRKSKHKPKRQSDSNSDSGPNGTSILVGELETVSSAQILSK